MCWVWDFYGCYLIRWVLEGTCYNSASFFYLLKMGTKLYFALRWTQEWEVVFSGKHFIIFDKFTLLFFEWTSRDITIEMMEKENCISRKDKHFTWMEMTKNMKDALALTCKKRYCFTATGTTLNYRSPWMGIFWCKYILKLDFLTNKPFKVLP